MTAALTPLGTLFETDAVAGVLTIDDCEHGDPLIGTIVLERTRAMPGYLDGVAVVGLPFFEGVATETVAETIRGLFGPQITVEMRDDELVAHLPFMAETRWASDDLLNIVCDCTPVQELTDAARNGSLERAVHNQHRRDAMSLVQ